MVGMGIYGFKVLQKKFEKKPTKKVKKTLDLTQQTTRFERAALLIETFPDIRSNTQQKLQLYGLFKQSVFGPCNTQQPSASVVDMAGVMKWEAWNSLSHLGKKDAEEQYVELVKQLLTSSKRTDEEIEHLFANCSEEPHGKQIQFKPIKNARQLAPQWANPAAFKQFYHQQLPVPSSLKYLLADVSREERNIGSVPVCVYKERAAALQIDPTPIVVYFHGGGWIAGDLDTDDTICRFLAHNLKCTVVSVDYGTVPEQHFPQGLEQCYDVTEYVLEHAAEFGGHRKLVGIAGFDAGANIAASLCIMNRDLNPNRETSQIAFQLLLCPMLRYASEDDATMGSYKEHAYLKSLSSEDMRWLWSLYIPEDLRSVSSDKAETTWFYASPFDCTEGFKGLPSAYIVTADKDPNRDEALMYANKLNQDGVTMNVATKANMEHFFIQDLSKQESQDVLQEAVQVIQQWLAVRNLDDDIEENETHEDEQEKDDEDDDDEDDDDEDDEDK